MTGYLKHSLEDAEKYILDEFLDNTDDDQMESRTDMGSGENGASRHSDTSKNGWVVLELCAAGMLTVLRRSRSRRRSLEHQSIRAEQWKLSTSLLERSSERNGPDHGQAAKLPVYQRRRRRAVPGYA